jgi:hypothetical protein
MRDRGYTLGTQKGVFHVNFSVMAKSPAKTSTRRKTAAKTVSPPQKKVGRPRAKHSDPAYKQMSVYIHQDVRGKVKARLFEEGGEFSALVESLLREWLKKH